MVSESHNTYKSEEWPRVQHFDALPQSTKEIREGRY